MNYYNEIKDKLIKNEVSKKIKNYYANKNDLTTYYEVGKLLSMAGKHYGEGIIKEYSIKLQNDIGKKYSITSLKYMRQFYLFIKSQPVADQLYQITWSHYQELLPIKNIVEVNYYIKEVISQHLSKRDLREKIKSKEYERLPESTKQKLANKDKLDISDYIKHPIILHDENNYEKISEYALKEMILNDLDGFLLQLGEGFSYIGNEYKIKMGNSYNYIDLLLFNIKYNCYVVVELKINKLTKQDVGQIQVYMNYVDDNIKGFSQDKTIGIIVAKENNEYIIKYSSDSRIKVTTYMIV